MLLTRIGKGTKMIITGDLNQSDLNINNNGLLQIYNKLRNSEKANGLNCVRYVELEKEDVQRSRAAKTVLDIYEHDHTHPFTIKYVKTDLNEVIDKQVSDDEKSSKSSDSELHLYENLYNDEDQYSNEFEYLNQVIHPSPYYEEIHPLTVNNYAEPLYMNESIILNNNTISIQYIEKNDDRDRDVDREEDVDREAEDNEMNEWIDIDNDAALIPLRHIKRTSPKWKNL